MTVENLRLRLVAAESPTELIEGIRDAMRRGYTDNEIMSVVGTDNLVAAEALIPDGACNGLCLTGSDVGILSAEIAYPHPDCPEHGQ